MVTEIALIAGATAAGAISAAVIEKLSRAAGGNKKIKSQERSSTSTTARAELVSLLFEKTLASEAITRVYEAAQEGRIDRLERDRLLLKYRQQLDLLNQKVADLQPVADYADLSELRNNLASLLDDQKLLEMSKKNGISQDNSVDARARRIIAETTKVQPLVVDQMPFKSEERSIEQLQSEIVQALERLEQVEIDKD
jgi:nitrogen-specific signal transduction histidine kinase